MNLTAAEAQVEVPLVTTETEGASRQSQFRLSTALQARQITGTIAGLVKWFDFIPAVGGNLVVDLVSLQKKLRIQ